MFKLFKRSKPARAIYPPAYKATPVYYDVTLNYTNGEKATYPKAGYVSIIGEHGTHARLDFYEGSYQQSSFLIVSLSNVASITATQHIEKEPDASRD